MQEVEFKKGLKIKHEDHYGYVHDDELTCFDKENKQFLQHSLEHKIEKNCIKVNHHHTHEGNQKIRHLDHFDYIVGNRLHYVHDDHCDDHGEIEEWTDDLPQVIETVEKIASYWSYWRFIIMIILTGGFFLVEFVVGIIIESLALQADALHMLSDLIALIIAFYSVFLSKRDATERATYGWVRAEIIGALVNGTFLISSCFFIIIEAIHRFREFRELADTLGEEVDLLLLVGGIGLLVNLIGVTIFLTSKNGHGHSHGHTHDKTTNNKKIKNKKSLNIRALLLHMVGDILGSIGVVCGGLIIKFLTIAEDYRYLADPIMSLFIVILILINAVPLVRQCIHILLHKVPKNIDVKKIRNEIMNIDGVCGVHHLHVWQLNDARVIGTVHILLKTNFDEVYNKIQNIMHANGVHATTIQPEIYDIQSDKCQNIKCDNKRCEDCCQKTSY